MSASRAIDSEVTGVPAGSASHQARITSRRENVDHRFVKPEAPPSTNIRESVKDLDEILANSARQQAEEGAELARQRGLEARSESVESAAGVWRSLLEATVPLGAGVIVAGSRGRGAIASTMLGSVSSGLVHNAELPVLIVPSLSAARST